MTNEILRPEVDQLEAFQCQDLLPPKEVLLAVRREEVPILNLKNPRETCPLACGYCDTSGVRSKVISFRSENNFEKIVGIINTLQKDYGLQAVEFCGDGEPLNDWELITYLLEKGLKLSLFTNGVFITEGRAEFLTQHGAIVKVKLDSLDPQIFGKILLGQREEATSSQARAMGKRAILGTENMLKTQERLGFLPGRLIASIVVTNVNFSKGAPIEEAPLGEVLRFCQENLIVPQVNYVEKTGGNVDNRYGIERDQVREINRYLRELFGVDPKKLSGENCFAMFAPIITTDGLLASGPFGMGCEFPLRDHIGKLGEVWILSKSEELKPALLELDEFRKGRKNREAIIEELRRVQRRERVYGASGTDEILPGCGAGCEENYLLIYTATLFGSDDYLERKIFPRLDKILVEKWSSEEVEELIKEVSL